MSRVPEPGNTKTRLMNKLSGDECAGLHRSCLRDICRIVRNTEMPAFLYYAGSKNQSELDWGNAVFDPWDLRPEDYMYFTMRQQKGFDLGIRMLNAASEVLIDYDAVMFLGSDMPCLSPRLLLEANERLHDHDLVVGPAEDGGYYLLAMKMVYEALFKDIPWSTYRVLQMTLQVAEKSGLSYSRLPGHSDIDTWEDLLSFYKKGLFNKDFNDLDSYKYTTHLIRKYGCRERDELFGCKVEEIS